jgi:hypothetical protein
VRHGQHLRADAAQQAARPRRELHRGRGHRATCTAGSW